MELDVHLSRVGEESWGFRLIGGVDYAMPLTVVKVLPNSPADQAGLQNGDAVSRINNTPATDMTHEESRKAVAAAYDYLTLGVTRGLYDPVLDDTEPILDPIDQEDFDQPSRPTEVFELKDFTDLPQLCNLQDLLEIPKLSESRSLTASPFVLPSKPYRPFSTEPLTEVPVLEEPIILNPDYHDVFSKLGIDEDYLPKTRFKLPISEQYDPDGTKQKMTDTSTDINKKDVIQTATEVIRVEERIEQTTTDVKELVITRNEVNFEEMMKQEIVLNKIELTASSVVNESIEKAVTVAEEIKKEIDVELYETSTIGESKIESSLAETKQSQATESSISKQEVTVTSKAVTGDANELINLLDKTTDEIVNHNKSQVKVHVAKEVEKIESINKQQHGIEETKCLLHTKHDIEDSIEAGCVKRNTTVFEKEADNKRLESIDKSKISEKDITVSNKVAKETVSKSETTDKVKCSTKSDEHNTSKDTKISTTKLLAEQRAYTIGLQTIPNIRGSVHSSYHYNLLLKTFFIHLTDVMVALSRFILAEPVLSKDIGTEECQVLNKKVVKEQGNVDIKTCTKVTEENKTSLKEDIMESKKKTGVMQVIKDKITENHTSNDENTQDDFAVEEREKELLPGSKMAQLSEKKPVQLIQTMGAVISEFENKAGIEESTEKRDRRSRSRSKIEEDVMKESDPLEWLAKHDGQKDKVVTDIKSSTETFKSVSESMEMRKTESRHELTEIMSSNSKEENNTYIAIVEAHVYTNKDAILDAQITKISETTSVQNDEQTNISMEAIESVSSEKVAIEHELIKEELANCVIEAALALSTENAIKNEAIIQTTEETHQSEAFKETEVKQTSVFSNSIFEKKQIVMEEKLESSVDIEEVKSTNEDLVATVTDLTEKIIIEDIAVDEINDECKPESSVEIQEVTSSVIEKQDIKIEEQSLTAAITNACEESIVNEVLTKCIQKIKEEEAFGIFESSIERKEDLTVKEKAEEKTEITAGTNVNQIIAQSIQEVKLEQTDVISASIVGQEQELVVEVESELIKDVCLEEAIVNQVMEEQTAPISESTLEKKEELVVKEEPGAAVETQEVKSTISEKEATLIVKDTFTFDATEKSVALRPTTLDLRLDEDPHIVKKKLNIMVSESTHDEDPHIIKKTSEIKEDESTTKLSTETTAIVNNLTPESEKAEIAALKISKEQVTEVNETVQSTEETKVTIKLQTETTAAETKSYQSFATKSEEIKTTEQTFESQHIEQESSFVARSIETVKHKHDLTLRTDLAEHKILHSQDSTSSDENNLIDTPTPSTIPPTPLTDEYVFKLQIALPRGITPIPPDPLSPEADEDPHIVKKKLIPHIDATIEEAIVYDPPLPTPPGSKVTSPVYTKPGLRGGGVHRRERPKEEILEIERKSSLLASAIDQTIKSIEEYNEEVGIKREIKEQKIKENAIMYNGYSKVIDTKVFNGNEEVKIDEQSKTNKTIESDNNDSSENTTITVKMTDDKDGNETSAKIDAIDGYRPVQFDPAEIQNILQNLRSAHLYSNAQESTIKEVARQMYKTETGELLGTTQGIVDGLEEVVVDSEIAKELGKPGMTEEKIAELMSGESEMLREAHVMGLSRVLKSHMHRANDDDSSVDFKKIKPIVDSLKDSEVLKALNDELIDELMKAEEKKKKEEKKWTTFLQKPTRPVPNAKFGYYGFVQEQEDVKEPYKVKIVKQPKPKVAPDFKPEDFNTGLLPWEERALREPTPPPVAPEDPILVPEEAPEILEAVDPLPESEVPDLEDSGIPLPPPKPIEEDKPEEDKIEKEPEEEINTNSIAEETEDKVEETLPEEMDQRNVAEQLIASVQNMVDPAAPLEQQLAQMRAQLAALAQLPGVIQQSLELVTRQLSQLSQIESTQVLTETPAACEEIGESELAHTNSESVETTIENQQESEEKVVKEELASEEQAVVEETKSSATAEEIERMRKEEEEMLEEQRKMETQKKELMEQMRLEQEARQLKQRPTPRVGKPKPVFGPITPQERPLVLPGGRKWRKPKDAYNDQFFTETLAAQAEIIQGKVKGLSYESVLLLYDERINFMKYEKPPVSLDHLKDSDVYKMIHNMEQPSTKRVDMLTPVICEADYREKCRSNTPCVERMEEHQDIPQQVQP